MISLVERFKTRQKSRKTQDLTNILTLVIERSVWNTLMEVQSILTRKKTQFKRRNAPVAKESERFICELRNNSIANEWCQFVKVSYWLFVLSGFLSPVVLQQRLKVYNINCWLIRANSYIVRSAYNFLRNKRNLRGQNATYGSI